MKHCFTVQHAGMQNISCWSTNEMQMGPHSYTRPRRFGNTVSAFAYTITGIGTVRLAGSWILPFDTPPDNLYVFCFFFFSMWWEQAFEKDGFATFVRNSFCWIFAKMEDYCSLCKLSWILTYRKSRYHWVEWFFHSFAGSFEYELEWTNFLLIFWFSITRGWNKRIEKGNFMVEFLLKCSVLTFRPSTPSHYLSRLSSQRDTEAKQNTRATFPVPRFPFNRCTYTISCDS